MYGVYKPIVYNNFFKNERKKRDIKLEDLAKQIHYSIGFISQLENTQNPLTDDKTHMLLTFYGYDIDYLLSFDNQLNQLMENFIHHILYIDDNEVNNVYQQLILFFNHYSDTELFNAFYLVQFIYNIYFFDHEKSKYFFDLINQYTHLYTNKYQALLNIYTARYYIHLMKYDQAIELLTSPIFNGLSDINLNGFLNITLSACYMHKKDIAKAIRYCDDAIGNFSNTNNYRRLLNTNITKGNQLLKIKDYTGYIELNNRVLENAKRLNYTYEKNTLLQNNAFAYMMQNDYEKALDYYREIPTNEMKENPGYSYLICLVETGNNKEAIEVITQWINKTSNLYYKNIFEIYHEYLLTNNLLKLNKGLIKILKSYRNSLNMFEIEFLHVLIAYHYKQLKMYKNSMEYLEKLRELDFCE